MVLHFDCPRCNKPLDIAIKAVNKVVKCPGCGEDDVLRELRIGMTDVGREALKPAMPEDDYAALTFLSALYRVVGLICLAAGVALFAVGMIAIAFPTYVTPNVAYMLWSATLLISSLISFAAASGIRLLVDIVVTLRAIRDK